MQKLLIIVTLIWSGAAHAIDFNSCAKLPYSERNNCLLDLSLKYDLEKKQNVGKSAFSTSVTVSDGMIAEDSRNVSSTGVCL